MVAHARRAQCVCVCNRCVCVCNQVHVFHPDLCIYNVYLNYTYYIIVLKDAYGRLLESECTQLCKYIHIVVKCGPRQYEKGDVSRDTC